MRLAMRADSTRDENESTRRDFSEVTHRLCSRGITVKGYVDRLMIRQIAPQFFTTEMAATLAYYKDKLGFNCVGTWEDPPVCARYRRA